MSPKKRKQRKPRNPARPEAAAPTGPRPRASRTPVVVQDPPDRRITALWVLLTLLWALGTPLALANLLFTTMDVQDAAHLADGPQDTTAAVDAVGDALVWLLVLALAVPAAAALAAALLRRKIAAIGFTAALAVSAVPLLWLMPPAELADALTAHLLG